MNTKKLCLVSVFTAIVFVVTRFLQIPIPLGYFNIGNCIILLFCYIMPSPYGLLIGGIGSALADLTSFPVWTLPTLIIKTIMPLIYYILLKLFPKKGVISCTIAASISMLIPFAGYTVTGAIIYGSIAAGLSQVPGLFIEYIANVVIYVALLILAKKLNLWRIYELTESQSSK